MSDSSLFDQVSQHHAFLAKLRHELRTPLNPIIGYSEMLIEDLEDMGESDLLQHLQGVHGTGQKLLNLVNEFLDPVRVEAGLLDVDLPTLRVAMLMNFEVPSDLVIKFSKAALLCAQDEGTSAVVADIEKILTAGEKFSYLINEVAELDQESAADHWQSKEKALAMQRHAAETLARLESREKKRDAYVGKILVVDDNEVNRDVLARHLSRHGHTVSQAGNGRLALEMMAAQDFDLVLLDILMPELDGYQVLQRLKSDEDLRDIPVIMISALDELESIVRCIKLGAEDYLSKPYDPVLLQARIGAGLEKKRFRDQELEYLHNVALVTAAAAAVEGETFAPAQLQLDDVADREDALGLLARVFQKMAREVYFREQRLKQQVQELKIELDMVKQDKQVEEIVESDFFKQLESEADELRGLFDDL